MPANPPGAPARRRLAAAAVAAVVAVGACGSPPPPPPVAPGFGKGVLFGRHFDQVCRDTSRPTALRAHEVFDTAGLGAVLADARPSLGGVRPPWPKYEHLTRYAVDGSVDVSGTWDYTIAAAAAERLEAELTRRALPLRGVIEPTGVRVRAVLGPRITFATVPPAVCMPHIAHAPGRSPYGLPDSVRTNGGGRHVPRGVAVGAVVRIHVAPDGSVERLEEVDGSPAGLALARHVVGLLTFEPALDNGVPVSGVLQQTFRLRGR